MQTNNMLSNKYAKKNACGDHQLNYTLFTEANLFLEIKKKKNNHI